MTAQDGDELEEKTQVLKIDHLTEHADMLQSFWDQLILGVAHELNNPNAYIRLNASNLTKMIDLLDPAIECWKKQNLGKEKSLAFGPFSIDDLRNKIKKSLNGILDASVRIVLLTDKLKQITAASISEAKDVSIYSILDHILSTNHYLFEPGIEAKINHQENISYQVHGYSLQLEQAFTILIANARDAIRERWKDTPGGTLEITLTETPNTVTIHFEDNGIGMTKSVLEHIFNPYYTTKPQGKGEGLGLALCKSFILRHCGDITVISKKEQGTKFTVVLPKQLGVESQT
jgi:signal transduction histidine kinase